jgi:MFS family permease
MSHPHRLVTPAFALVLGTSLAYFLAFAAMLPVLPVYVAGPLGGGGVAVGIVAASFSLTALLLRPWAARMADRRGRPAAMATGAALAALAAAGAVFAPSLPVLVALRIAAGAGEALFFVAAATAVGDLAPPSRSGEAMSWFSLTPYISLAIGPALGEAAMGADPGAAAIAAPCLVSTVLAGFAVALARRMPETRPAGVTAPGATTKLQRSALLPGVVLMASIVGLGGFNAFAALHARAAGLDSAAPVFATAAGVLIAVRVLGARVPDRIGARACAAIALTGGAAGLATMSAWATPAGLICGAAVFGAGQALAFPALMAMAVRAAAPHQRAGVVATMTIFIDLGFGLGPLTAGGAAAAIGAQWGFAALACVVSLGLAVLAVTGRSRDGVTLARCRPQRAWPRPVLFSSASRSSSD